MVFEYCECDLRKLMNERQLTEEEIQRFTRQLLLGIKYAHENRIIHRDLKPQNLLIDIQGNLKIADFGLARSFTYPIQPLTHEVVTLWYRAPEVLLGQEIYTVSIDMWAVGCIIAEMYLSEPFFNGSSDIEQIFKIFEKMGHPTSEDWPDLYSLPYYNEK